MFDATLSVLEELCGQSKNQAHTWLLPGHGQRPAPNPQDSFAHICTQEVEAALQAMPHSDGISCIGYSLGGRILLGALPHLNPTTAQAIERMVIVGGGLGGLSPSEAQTRAIQDQSWAEKLQTYRWEDFLEAWLKQPIFASQKKLAQSIQKQAFIDRGRHNPQALAQTLKALSVSRMPYALAAAKHSAHKIIWVCGSQDPVYASRYQQLAHQIPMRPHLLPHCGHNPFLEEPEAIADLIAGIYKL